MPKQYSEKVITAGINKLSFRLFRIIVMARILDIYLTKFISQTKTEGFEIILDEVVAHMAGQLSRVCFDKSNKQYKLASLLEIYGQIKNFKQTTFPKGSNHKKEFDQIEPQLCSLENSYKPLQEFCDKFYAHTEIANQKGVITEDKRKIHLSWEEINTLIDKAKEILNKISLYWTDTQCNFYEDYLPMYSDDFWNLNLIDVISKAPQN